MPLLSTKAYIESLYDLDSRQVSQETAGYNPLGGTETQACANCNWFVPGDVGCIVVSGDVVPTGKSNLWLEKPPYVQDPIPVVIMADESAMTDDKDKDKDKDKKKLKPGYKSVLDTVLSAIGLRKPLEEKLNWITWTKDSSDPEAQTRFVIWASNNFKDKEGSIFKESAHKDFIAWADEKQSYPEVWLWHAAGSRLGQVDWLDYNNGFVVASGLFDKEAESILANLKQEELGASHGFLYTAEKPTEIDQYRSWEISLLPSWAAANSWTSYAAIKEEDKMGFSEAKKAWLKDIAKVPEEKIAAWEQQTDQMASHLQSLGVEWKSTETETESEEVPPVQDVTPILSAVQDLQAALNLTVGQLASLSTTVKGLQEGEDSRFSSLLESRLAQIPGGGFKASERDTKAPDGVTDESNKRDLFWFGSEVLQPAFGTKS